MLPYFPRLTWLIIWSLAQPREFLTASDSGACVGYWTFGDGAADTQAGTLINALYAPLLQGTASAVQGGTVPVFSAETPAAETPRITDGDGGPVVNIRNASSLRFVNAGLAGTGSVMGGGDVAIPAGQLAPLTNFTAEAFVRADRHVGYPQIIGKERKNTSGLSWSLAVNADGNLRARFDTQTPPSSSGFNQTFESTGKVEDGKWHHVALAYDGATGTARLYLDYAKVLEGTVANPLCLDGGDIHVGSGDMAFDGWIDEVRVSDRVLAPAAFLHAAPVVGSVTAIQ